jgi:hypothetical protein
VDGCVDKNRNPVASIHDQTCTKEKANKDETEFKEDRCVDGGTAHIRVFHDDGTRRSRG